jgi:hypothetical protein
MVDRSDHRVSDQDRDRALLEIREHFAAGRLTAEELSDRVQALHRAQTQSDLRRQLADLPQLPAPPAEQRAELDRRREHLQLQLLQQSGAGLIPFLICMVIWLGSDARGIWPLWVALLALIPLVRNLWRLYGPAPELDRIEQELARRERREAQREALRDAKREEVRERFRQEP